MRQREKSMTRFYNNIDRLPRVGDAVSCETVNEGRPVSGLVTGRTEHHAHLMLADGRDLDLDIRASNRYRLIEFCGLGADATAELEGRLRATVRRSSRRRAQIRHLSDSAHTARMERDEARAALAQVEDELARAEDELLIRRRVMATLMSALETRSTDDSRPILRAEHEALSEQLELMEIEGYAGEAVAGLEHRLAALDQQLQRG